MNTPDPKQLSESDELDEILDSVYEAGYKQSRLQLEGKGANTITSTALWEAKQAIQALYAKQQSEAIKEFEDKLNADVLETFTKILLKYGWEYGEDVQHDWTLFRVPNKLLNAYKEDPQHFIAQLTQDTTNTKGGEDE